MTPPRRPSERLPPVSDPLVAPVGRPSANPAMGAPVPLYERGIILEVDARRHSYRVVMSSGRQVSMGRIRTSPGDTALLEQGTNVAVFMGFGEPYIWGILPMGTAHSDEGPTLTGVDGHGGADSVLDRGLTASARDPNMPTDLLPGDAAIQGPDGASVSALRGKVAQLQGGPLARVQAFGDGDRVSIVAGELHTTTWMGESAYTNNEGQTNFRWRGGTDQLTQTGADESRYTIALDVGSVGDVIRLELTNREGQALFRFHVDAHGHAELFSAGGFSHVGGDSAAAIHESAHHGSATHEVTGDRAEHVVGTRKDTIGGSWQTTTGASIEILAGTDLSLSGVNSAVLRSGGELTLSAANLARLIGTNVTLDPRLGEFLVETSLDDKITLGRGATSHGVMYEPLERVLTQILNRLNSLASAFASHGHPVVLTPTPTAQVNPAASGYVTPLQIEMAPMKAKVVRLR